MEWFKSISDGKGGFNTFNWNLGDLGMEFGMKMVGGLFAVVIFSFILPVLALLFYPISNQQDRLGGIIVTLLTVVYLLLDAHYGWYLSSVFAEQDLVHAHKWIIAFNLSLLIVNGFLFFLNGAFERMSAPMFYIFVIGSTYVFWFPMMYDLVYSAWS